MSKEVKRYDPLLGLARNAKLRRMDMQCDPQWVLDLAAERDALLADRDAAQKDAERYRWMRAVVIAEREGCTEELYDSECDRLLEAYDAALQGEQP